MQWKAIDIAGLAPMAISIFFERPKKMNSYMSKKPIIAI